MQFCFSYELMWCEEANNYLGLDTRKPNFVESNNAQTKLPIGAVWSGHVLYAEAYNLNSFMPNGMSMHLSICAYGGHVYADQSLYYRTCIMQIHVVYDLNRYLTDVTCTRPPDKSVYWKIIFFFFLIQNICCGYS